MSENTQITIWLIEDNDFYRETIHHLLAANPLYRCTKSFRSCEGALQALHEDELPDIILSDIGLPGMSGIEGIEHFKRITPSTHIIMLSVFGDEDKLFKALCAGASGYLLKSSSEEEIIKAIDEVIAGGAPMTPSIAKKVLALFSKLTNTKNDYGLTNREKDILQQIVNGLTIQQIADTLFLSYHTVNTHLKNIYSKLHVNTRSAVVAKVFSEKLLD